MDYKSIANAALERRKAIVGRIEAEGRQATEVEKREIATLTEQAEDAVTRGEVEAEARALGAASPGLVAPRREARNGGEATWRAMLPSLGEYRALNETTPSDGGYAVPEEVASKYVDALRAKSALMRALPAENVIPMHSKMLTLPAIDTSAGAVFVGEGDAIPENNLTVKGLDLTAIKFARLSTASNEVLDDANVDMRKMIAHDFVASISQAVDSSAFSGSGTDSLNGLLTQVPPTVLTAAVTWDDVADSLEAIEAANGEPSVVWCSPDVASTLRKEKASGTGAYMAGGPTEGTMRRAWSLPMLVTTNVPAKTLIVADASRIRIGVRRDVRVAQSVDAAFDSDAVKFRVTYRVAGVSLAEAAAVSAIQGV